MNGLKKSMTEWIPDNRVSTKVKFEMNTEPIVTETMTQMKQIQRLIVN